MFSPTKAIVAGALVFALSAAFLVAQPFDRLGGGVPGAEQPAEPAAPVEVTGRFIDVKDCTEDEGGTTEGCDEVDYEWSDPRLEGTGVLLTNSTAYDLPDGSGIIFDYRRFIIENDEGAWRMRPQVRLDAADLEGGADPDDSPWWWVLDGEGAYDGLSAVLIYPNLKPFFPPGYDNDIHGFIVPSELLPPAPEGASTE